MVLTLFYARFIEMAASSSLVLGFRVSVSATCLKARGLGVSVVSFPGIRNSLRKPRCELGNLNLHRSQIRE